MTIQDTKTRPTVIWMAPGFSAMFFNGSTSQRISPLTDSRSQIKMQSVPDRLAFTQPVCSGWMSRTAWISAMENGSIFMLLTGE